MSCQHSVMRQIPQINPAHSVLAHHHLFRKITHNVVLIAQQHARRRMQFPILIRDRSTNASQILIVIPEWYSSVRSLSSTSIFLMRLTLCCRTKNSFCILYYNPLSSSSNFLITAQHRYPTNIPCTFQSRFASFWPRHSANVAQAER